MFSVPGAFDGKTCTPNKYICVACHMYLIAKHVLIKCVVCLVYHMCLMVRVHMTTSREIMMQWQIINLCLVYIVYMHVHMHV